MRLKLVENNGKTFAEVAEGKPVYVHDDGKELGFDAPQAMSRISALNGEAKSHRERAEKYEAALKGFEGIEDPEAARKAMETLKNLDEGKLIQAGKVEEIKASAQRAMQENVENAKRQHAEELQKLQLDRDRYKNLLHRETIGNAFARSKFISDKVAVPVDLVQSMFERNFNVTEDGKLVAKDVNGQTIGSRSNFGEPADFEEAIESLVSSYQHKDAILRGTGNAGSGARPAANGAAAPAGGKVITRSEFERLDPVRKQVVVRDHRIVDA